MKIKFIKVMPYLTTLLLLFLYVKNVNAGVDYRIENNVTTASIKEDGSIAIKKQITYKFKSQSKGVFYQQNLTAKQNLTNAKVIVQDENKKAEYNYPFKLQKKGHKYCFTIYHKVKPNSRYTVTYFYEISRAVINYRDIAELNFMIIGNNWDKSLDHVRAVVLFPNSMKNLKAWAHGPQNGYIKVDPSKGRIMLTANNLDGHSGIEVHTIFPLSATPRNKNIVNQIHGPFVLKQEARLAQEANCKRKKAFAFLIGLMILTISCAVIAIGLGFSTKRQGDRVWQTETSVHNYTIPTVNAVVAQILDQVNLPNASALTAYIMELAVQKKLTITDYQKGQQTFFRITLNDRSLTKVDPLLAALFNIVGNGQAVTTEEIKNNHGEKISHLYNNWRVNSYNKVVSQGLLVKKLMHKRSFNQFMICSLLLVSLGGTMTLFFKLPEYRIGLLIAAIFLLLLGIAALVHSNNMISSYSKEGAEITNQIRGFKHMLKDIGRFKMRDVGDLTFWEEIMPYAVAFNLAEKVLKQLKIEFTTDEWKQSNFYLHEPIYKMNGEGLYESFNSSLAIGVDSAADGTSGCFSSGTSGGFGGGSGGGAF